jgi:hypothetical protein
LYAIHGAVNVLDNSKNPIGSIAGKTIKSEGAVASQGNTASYGATIKDGSITGRFDWGTEVGQGLFQGTPIGKGWVIAVPLESPAVWGGVPGKISIFASEISSSVEANGVSKDAYDAGVSAKNWLKGNGFASPSEAGVDPST